MSSALSSFKTIFDTKGSFHVRQLEVGEEGVRNEVRVGLYGEDDHCVGNVTLRVDPENGEPLFVITTGGDGYFEKAGPLVVVAPTRPYTEAVMLFGQSQSATSGGLTPMRASSDADARRIAQLEHERETLGNAIRDIAIAGGICRDDVPLTGPDLLMLCDHIKSAMGEPSQVTTPPTALYLATHEHRHGDDQYLFSFQPSDEDVIAAINAVSSYEPDQGERFYVDPISAIDRGAFIGVPTAPRPRG